MSFKILSLDGGGVRGLIGLQILQKLEQQKPGFIGQADLIAGTSIGGITALALINGWRVEDLIELFEEDAPKLFWRPRPYGISNLKRLIRPKYNNGGFRDIVDKLFADKTLGDVEGSVIVTAFALDNIESQEADRRWQPRMFHNLGQNDVNNGLKLSDLAMYTGASPCYFPSIDGYVDGGVISNNPGLLALTVTQDKTINLSDRPAVDDIVLLSFGTGKYQNYIEGQRHDWGYWQWRRYMLDLMLEGSVSLTNQQCTHLLNGRYHRINPLLPRRYHADEWQRLDELKQIGQDADIETTVAWLEEHWSSSL